MKSLVKTLRSTPPQCMRPGFNGCTRCKSRHEEEVDGDRSARLGWPTTPCRGRRRKARVANCIGPVTTCPTKQLVVVDRAWVRRGSTQTEAHLWSAEPTAVLVVRC